MFEQSVVTFERRPWTMAASLPLQCAAAGGILLASLVHLERLPLASPRMPLPPVPKLASPVVELVEAPEELSQAAGQTIPVVHKPLVVPTRIPTHVSQVIDNFSQIAAPVAAISAAYADGVAKWRS